MNCFLDVIEEYERMGLYSMRLDLYQECLYLHIKEQFVRYKWAKVNDIFTRVIYLKPIKYYKY